MNVIERLATAIEQESSNDMEAICRYTVAAEMRHERRMLTADEIEDIVADVVADEAHADPEDRFDGEVVEVTDLEAANMDDIAEFTDEDGETIEGVVVGGKFARLVVKPDQSVRVISASIAKHSEALAHMASVNGGINLKSMYHPVPDVNMPCPTCASRNVTPVWFDSGQVTACCNECGMEFDASVDDVAHATLAERTVEDIDILPEFNVFGSVWLNGDGYGYEIYASGDMVDSGEAETFDEVQERFDDIADAYDEIGEGTGIDFANGDSDIVELMENDDVYFGSRRKASRIRLARMVASKKAFIDNSGKVNANFREGQEFSTRTGSIIVDSVLRDDVYATVIEGTADGRIAERVAKFTANEFDSFLRKNGCIA